MKPKLPYKTFNLFFSYNAQLPFAEKLYKWVTSVGKYIVIGVELVVLTAFIARFFLDQSLNNLADSVSDNNKAIISYKDREDYFRRIFSKTDSTKSIQNTSDPDFILELKTLYSSAPTDIKIESVSYDEKGYSVRGSGSNASLQVYKSNLETNVLGGGKINVIEVDVSGSSSSDGKFFYKVVKKPV